jgi:hypothetical protein
MRKKQRKQAMLNVDRSVYEWRDLETSDEICNNVISIIGDCAIGTDVYTGIAVLSSGHIIL